MGDLLGVNVVLHCEHEVQCKCWEKRLRDNDNPTLGSLACKGINKIYT